MKKSNLNHALPVVILILSLSFLNACDDNIDELNNITTNQIVTQADKAALLFMLEEEKLARDTYMYLDNLWSSNQFANIKNSEQSHMNAIENLLIQYNVDYTILAIGEFENPELQDFYDLFVIDGAISLSNALQIGATIEDLDIVDLQDYIDASSNTALISVFGNLQCGSRNHLRSFVSGIENIGDSYTPQYLSQEEYEAIIAASREQCN